MRKLLSLFLAIAMAVSVMATAAAVDIQLSDTKQSTVSEKGNPLTFSVDSDARYTLSDPVDTGINATKTDGDILYGCVLYDATTGHRGWVEIDVNNPDTYRIINTMSEIVYAATYDVATGYTYGMWTADNNMSFSFGIMDVIGGELTQIAYAPEHITGLAMDYTTGTMYGIAPQSNSLYSIDKTTGEFTLVGVVPIESIALMIAIDTAGTMYVVSGEASLYSINKTTAEATLIGETGQNAAYAQGLTYDHDSQTLYWAQYGMAIFGETGALYRIDTQTGAAEYIGEAENSEIAGLHTVTVGPELDDPVPIEGVELSIESALMYEDDNMWLSATVLPEGEYIADRTVTYSSSDESVAVVNDRGYLTALNVGSATITVTTVDGGFTDTLDLTVQSLEEYYRDLSIALNAADYGDADYYPIVSGGAYPFEAAQEDGRSTGRSTNQFVSPSTSYIETLDSLTLTGNTVISFDWKISTEDGIDNAIFYVNDEPVITLSGMLGWRSETWTVPQSGIYTLRWAYVKDSMIDFYDDTVWIDNIAIDMAPSVPLESITLTPETAFLLPGSEASLSVGFQPANAEIPEITWESSDTSVAVVEDGLITGVGYGEATITIIATTDTGTFTDECIVTVSAPLTPSELEYTPFEIGDSFDYTLGGGISYIADLGQGYYQYALGYTFEAEAGSGITWSTVYDETSPQIASPCLIVYDESFNHIETFSTEWTTWKFFPGYTGRYYIVFSILAPYEDTPILGFRFTSSDFVPIPVTDVTISPKDLELGLGRYNQLTATVEPEITDYPGVTWESSDESVVTVDENGRVYGVGLGTATVTVYAGLGDITDTAIITVVEPQIPEYDGYIYAYNMYDNTESIETGFVKYDPEYSAEDIEVIMPASYSIYSAAYYNGLVYCYDVLNFGSFAMIRFMTFDAVTMIKQSEVWVDGSMFPVDMAYDYVSDCLYATAVNNETGENLLVTVDMETGAMTTVAVVDEFSNGEGLQTLTSVTNGQLYGIGTDGVFYAVDKTDASLSPIADLDFEVAYVQTLVYNYHDGNMYWFQCEAEATNMVVFDHQTGDILSTELLGSGLTEVSGGYVFYTYTPSAIPVTGVTLDTTELSLSVGEEYTLTASVSPDNANIPDVIWSSDNESVARVDSNGTVTAVADGEAGITVTTVDGGFSDVCVVTVTDDNPTPTPPATEYELGDINMDNKVDTGDAAMVLRYSVDLVEFDEYQLILADYNADNKVDTGDAAGILRAAVGLR